jgi:excisionase family DNA binding protein
MTIEGLEDVEWIGPLEAAALLGVGVALLREWADAGDLPCLRTPGGHRRFRRSDVEELIRSRTHQQAAS